MTDAQILKPSALDSLRNLGGAKFLAELIDLFLQHAPEKIEAAQRGAQESNWTRVEHAVHALKSSAGNLGAAQVVALATQIEILAGDEKGNLIAPLFSDMDTAFSQLKELLEIETERIKK